MTEQTEKRAVLFADICGSTALYENLGDDTARRLIAECIDSMSRVVATHSGCVVKTIGDEVMCTFSDVETAYRAACDMQEVIKQSRDGARYPMYVRIGFHFGDVIVETNDVFGDTVNVASRVSAITRANQIMTTQAVVDQLPDALKEHAQRLMRADLKGKQAQLDIYLITWDFEDLLSTRIGAPSFRKLQDFVHEMKLLFREQSASVNKLQKTVILGRGNNCDVVVQSNFASRQHLKAELRLGKFYLVDQSTNGTFVRFSDGSVVYLNREEMVLQGAGTICLGQSFSDNPSDLIEFSIVVGSGQA